MGRAVERTGLTGGSLEGPSGSAAGIGGEASFGSTPPPGSLSSTRRIPLSAALGLCLLLLILATFWALVVYAVIEVVS